MHQVWTKMQLYNTKSDIGFLDIWNFDWCWHLRRVYLEHNERKENIDTSYFVALELEYVDPGTLQIYYRPIYNKLGRKIIQYT